MRRRHQMIGIFGALLFLALAACSLPVEITPMPPSTPPTAPPPSSTQEPSALLIDAVRILRDERPFSQYVVEIQGHFREGCVSLTGIKQRVQGGRISLTMITTRPQDAICTQALVPFTHVVPLNITGLEPGEYIVDIHGVTATLTLSQEDTMPPSKEVTPVEKPALSQGRAMIEEIDVAMAESYPVQVFVTLRGYLPDGCTKLAKITQEIEGHTIRLTIYTERPKEAICTMALVPFTETIPLNTQGLAPGTYTVLANGLKATFTIE